MKVATNWRAATLDSQERAMLEFAEKLTFTPGQMNETDLGELRQVGFNDQEVLAIVLAVSYRNFIARVADMLGVELTDSEKDPEEFLLAFGVTREQARMSLYSEAAVR